MVMVLKGLRGGTIFLFILSSPEFHSLPCNVQPKHLFKIQKIANEASVEDHRKGI